MLDYWKDISGAIASIIGAGIAFFAVWLTQRSTAKREESKSNQEKEAGVRTQALQFITDVVSAARAMSALTYYAGALPKGAPGFSARVKEYEKEIAVLLAKIQAGQITISFMADKLEGAAHRSWVSVRERLNKSRSTWLVDAF